MKNKTFGTKSTSTEIEGLIEYNLSIGLKFDIKSPLCIWGTHGIGKTEIVKGFAKKNNMKFEYIAPAQFEEMGDLHGIPEVIETNGVKSTKFISPNWVPKEEGPGILLLDDLNRADDRILRGCMQLIQNYELVSWKLPKGWQIVDENTLEAIKWIETNIQSANETLSNLISVAKARTQVLDNLIDLDIQNSLDHILSGFKTTIENENITIHKDLKDCKTVLFSESHFNSMLQNIIHNSIKYRSLDRDLEIEIKSFKDQNFNCISIKDNGIGINLKEHGSHVFGLFKRATDTKEGSGLALYLIKKILEKTGGEIKVESELGRGTTFTLCFNNKNHSR